MGSGTPPAPAERQYHSGSRPSTATGIAVTRTPATPRKELKAHGGGRESSAVQDPGLKDYRLGECLGKGAFGSVYKAFNWGTGEAVAVKQIKLANLPQSELRMIESEIELLKNLHHDNIVKYIGFVRSADCLNIILEYCENGSLHSICKAYGKFPENLVGVYMTQVLQGLHYLHDQGVIHRDIKGANILTTKDGTVKLADFGVSTSTLSGGGQDKEAQVVGTPYWMAPEIIQLSGASPASDIWSVGCTVIELLQGRPPYHHLAAMPALFAIVNDDHPPLPEGISAAPRDFLMQCFQKDPNLRVTARKLLRHPWIVGCRRSDAPVSKAPSNFNQAVEEVKQWNQALKYSETSLRTSTGSDGGNPMASNLAFTHFRASDGRESGDARDLRDKSSHQATHAGYAGHAGHSKGSSLALPKSWSIAEAFRSPELADDDNWDNDFATAISPSALQLPHLKPQDNFGGLLSSDRLKSFASASDSRNGQSPASRHEDEVEGDLLTIRPFSRKKSVESAKIQSQIKAHGGSSKSSAAPSPSPSHSPSPSYSHSHSHSLSAGASRLRPKNGGKSHFGAKFELPLRPDVVYREQSIEDFSDLFVDNDSVFKRGPNKVPTRKNSRQSDIPQLFHPSDLTNLPKSMQPPAAAFGGSARRQSASRPLVVPDRPMRRARSSIEIQKFAEGEADEDFSDIVFSGQSSSAAGRTIRDGDSDGGESEDGVGGLLLTSKVSGHSWLGDDEDEPDPFALMDPGWDEMDLEANIARDRHARLCERVEGLVRSLKTTEGEDTLSELAEDMLALLCDHSEVKDLIIVAHGLLPILEILEPCTVKSQPHMILSLLKVVNAIILDDVEIQENLCFVGGIPIVTKFAARQYSDEIRLQAAAFVRQMYQTSTLTLQMFVSAGGLNVLVEFLDEDYDVARDLVLIGVNGVWNVFELQGPTPKNDFCRIFSRSKILYPLALVLHRVLDEDGTDEIKGLVEGRIVNIFYLFSQAENYVKEVVADRQVLKSVLKDLRRMTPIHQVTMLRFIKNLSMLSTTLESLHAADAIEFLIDLLSYSMKKGGPGQRHFREISNQVLNTLFNLCRLSKERQEDAAVGGIVPLLLRIMQTDHPPKEFALPILCDMAHSGSKGRRYLWQNKGLDFYVSLLADQYWQVTAIDAILVWLQEETANVESHLLNGSFTAAVAGCLAASRIHALDLNLLEPLNKLLRLSPSIAATLARPELLAGVAQRLPHKNAVVRLNLLRLVRIILDACEPTGPPGAAAQTQARALMEVIRSLAGGDPAVLVRNLAQELVRSYGSGAGGGVGTATEAGAGPPSINVGSGQMTGGSISATLSSFSSSSSSSSSRRPGSSSRRRPALHASTSVPSTPTQGVTGLHRPSNSSVTPMAGLGVGGIGSYFEATTNPRRNGTATSTAVAAAIAANAANTSVYRPRSREGPPTAIPRRVSGDATGGAAGVAPPVAGGGGRAHSRLPRNSSLSKSGGSSSGGSSGGGSIITMLSASDASLLRSESSMSNKENNLGRTSRSGSASGAPGTTGFSQSSGKRRPPSSGTRK